MRQDNYDDKAANRAALRNRASDRKAIDRIIARTMVLDIGEEDDIAAEVEVYAAEAEKRERARKEKKAGEEITDEYSDDGPVRQWEDFENEEED